MVEQLQEPTTIASPQHAARVRNAKAAEEIKAANETNEKVDSWYVVILGANNKKKVIHKTRMANGCVHSELAFTVKSRADAEQLALLEREGKVRK